MYAIDVGLVAYDTVFGRLSMVAIASGVINGRVAVVGAAVVDVVTSASGMSVDASGVGVCCALASGWWLVVVLVVGVCTCESLDFDSFASLLVVADVDSSDNGIKKSTTHGVHMIFTGDLLSSLQGVMRNVLFSSIE